MIHPRLWFLTVSLFVRKEADKLIHNFAVSGTQLAPKIKMLLFLVGQLG